MTDTEKGLELGLGLRDGVRVRVRVGLFHAASDPRSTAPRQPLNKIQTVRLLYTIDIKGGLGLGLGMGLGLE
jgi:hypothetical protein